VGMIVAVFAATTLFIKRNWYDRLEPEPVSTKMVNVQRAQNVSR
jgi:hypothetical protein